MYILWTILAVICLVYYIVCATYAGINSSFIFIWLIGTALFGIMAVVRFLINHGTIHVPTNALRVFWTLFTVGVILFVILEGLIIHNMKKVPEDDCRYLLVLGCQIRGDHITKSLRKRLDTAYDYAKKNDSVTIIVSGGQGEGENLSEAQAMKNYLVERGIDEKRILMEDRSVNTDQNMRFSAAFIQNKQDKVGIVTSNFHIFRARLLAKAKGLTNNCGIASPSDPILFINYMVRESIGITKDFVMGNFKS